MFIPEYRHLGDIVIYDNKDLISNKIHKIKYSVLYSIHIGGSPHTKEFTM